MNLPEAPRRLLHRAPNIIAIPGTTTVSHLEENAIAAQLLLSSGEFAAFSAKESE